MTYQAHEIRTTYRDYPQALERFVGHPATVGVYEETEDSDGPGDTQLLMSVSGVVENIAVSTEENGKFIEVVTLRGMDEPISTGGNDGVFLIISGDVQ